VSVTIADFFVVLTLGSFDPELHKCHKQFKKLKSQQEEMERNLRKEYSKSVLPALGVHS
jgi:hypothetical protein